MRLSVFAPVFVTACATIVTASAQDNLNSETLTESLNRLDSADPYVLSLSVSNGTVPHVLPLDPRIGSDDAKHIQRTPRMQKVLRELSELPQDEAGDIVADRIYIAFEIYKEFFDAYFFENQDAFAPGTSAARGGVAFRSSDNPNGETTFLGARWGLLALVHIAGELKLSKTFPGIENVLDYALLQRESLYDTEFVDVATSTILLDMISLYSRQLLADSLVATCPNISEKDAFTDNVRKSMNLVSLDEYADRPLADLTQEEIVAIEESLYMSDARFDRIVEAIRLRTN